MSYLKENFMFADLLTQRINSKKSILCAGIDPVLESIPSFLFNREKWEGTEKDISEVLLEFSKIAIDSVKDFVACIKPNTAFFEQYGFGGLRALSELLKHAKSLGIPTIVDAKREDIGNTASAYAKAYLQGTKIESGSVISHFVGDALTVSPFLGFDTLAPFLEACGEGKGVFVLVKTSNPGSGDIQGVKSGGETISETVAKWVSVSGEKFKGKSGYSNLCAVVGGTYPEELEALRKLMPDTIFLIPGFGAQGGKASDIKKALDKRGGGIVCNSSRGLFGNIPNDCCNRGDLSSLFTLRAKALRDELNGA